ncbi:hypothetical protein TNCV_676221 [Trichonephila clavipes]|nr:hypothetical protein TNCV_676221 [Trichonephila clavipes]
MEWCEQQSECCPTQLLLLKIIRDLAAKKRRGTMLSEQSLSKRCPVPIDSDKRRSTVQECFITTVTNLQRAKKTLQFFSWGNRGVQPLCGSSIEISGPRMPDEYQRAQRSCNVPSFYHSVNRRKEDS